MLKKILLTNLLLLSAISFVISATHNISTLGGINDGTTDNTVIIQQAIDRCSAEGGGVVLLDGGGEYLSRTLYMKSYVTLRVEGGTTLLASPDITTYPDDTHKIMYKRESHMNRCFIYAEQAECFAFEGMGAIDGNGDRSNFSKGRPMLMRFNECSRITMRDITLQNPAAWTTAWLYCDDIVVDGVRIISRVNQNGDGLDFDGCTDVRVSNCYFDNSDDCICLQTSRVDRPCRRITVNNCIFKTKWAGIRIGLLSMADISHVTVSNCTFNDIEDAGLKIQQNEAGGMSDMVFTNLVMNNVPRPIFMTFCKQRACVDADQEVLDELKYMKRFIFSNIIVNNEELDKNSAFIFSGIPGNCIEDVTLSNIEYLTAGGGTKEDASRVDIPEFDLNSMKHHWPEYRCLGGALPAKAIYARHIRNFKVSDFRFKSSTPDARKLYISEDVEGESVDIVER
ncbi:MAG: glycosyl hydrolase family 28 protein [Rikenellaceae bacterium]